MTKTNTVTKCPHVVHQLVFLWSARLPLEGKLFKENAIFFEVNLNQTIIFEQVDAWSAYRDQTNQSGKLVKAGCGHLLVFSAGTYLPPAFLRLL